MYQGCSPILGVMKSRLTSKKIIKDLTNNDKLWMLCIMVPGVFWKKPCKAGNTKGETAGLPLFLGLAPVAVLPRTVF